MKWSTDWGLRGRMGLTMFLLFALYIVFIGILVTVTNAGMLTIVVMMGAFSFVQYFFSDKMALYSMGARVVDENEEPELHRMVERLCQQADLPKPQVAVADSQVPNAFATGRNQKNATVAVTTGLMRTLNQEELEGVMAHELAHIKNRDVMVMTIASFLSTIAFIVVRWGWLFGGNGRNQAPVYVAILASLVVWVISFFLIRALSRYREYSADRGAASITGNPAALASALMSISGRMDKVPQDDLREQAEMNAFFIIPIRSGFIGKIASTHPPTEKRIEKLRELEREQELA
ncbi:heat shock protein HtpX [Halohasta litchfieldiae]|uniref:Protease HtpX homolog n=1 Tax=Halohasta litchfieldiae TaxID=1073996 RepID=A0A1H6R8H7_9EURY|nr:zinc metalloprotease HtpX [Halohasta litchfieldiae]ATW88503.1 heat shock protein HtpX [Halohasta litchfieldiae]SEI49544.1 Heat shock protein. Metallo peptidase. MEROPS family M48B [Halohasta litchfieldiae]